MSIEDKKIPSEQSELLNKETYTDLELCKLKRLAAYLYNENAKLEDKVRDLETRRFRTFNDDECWIWQGDGSDYLESLSCPVVISPHDLRKIIKRRIKRID